MPVKKIVLVFPNTISIAEFVLLYKVNNIQINSLDKTIKGVIPPNLVKIACQQFKAQLSKDKSHYIN